VTEELLNFFIILKIAEQIAVIRRISRPTELKTNGTT